MGFEKITRPALLKSGAQINGGTTYTADVVYSSTGTVGIGPAMYVSTATLSTAKITLKKQGLALITYGTSGKPSDAIIPDPPRKGAVLKIVLDNNTTSIEANFNLATTARTFWGTTFNTVTVASTVGDTYALELTAVSTAKWAVTGISSTVHWTFAASTGSTGQ